MEPTGNHRLCGAHHLTRSQPSHDPRLHRQAMEINIMRGRVGVIRPPPRSTPLRIIRCSLYPWPYIENCPKLSIWKVAKTRMELETTHCFHCSRWNSLQAYSLETDRTWTWSQSTSSALGPEVKMSKSRNILRLASRDSSISHKNLQYANENFNTLTLLTLIFYDSPPEIRRFRTKTYDMPMRILTI